LKLPKPGQWNDDGDPWLVRSPRGSYGHTGPDEIDTIIETPIDDKGMKIDRMFFQRFEDKAKGDDTLKALINGERWELALEHVDTQLFEKPEDYFNLEKLRRALGIDRRLDLREILEKIFGLIPYFKSRDELLEDEFQKLLLDLSPEELANHADAIAALEYYFKAYATDGELRDIIDKKDKRISELHTNPAFGMADWKAVPPAWQQRIPEYIGQYVPLERFL